MTPSDATSSARSTVVTWMVRGVLAGMAVPTLALTPLLVRRIAHAVSGSGGEGAMWDEPLFYMVMMWLRLDWPDWRAAPFWVSAFTGGSGARATS